MAVTVTWVEFNGTDPDSGNGTALATNLNFGSTDMANLAPASYPIAAGSNSFVKYWKAQWSGSFTSISNAKIYKSSGDYVAGETLKFSGSYSKSGAPSSSALTVGDIPTSLPAENNVALPNLTSDTLSGPASGARSSTMVFQLQISSAASAGPVNQKVISLTYDRT